MNNENILTVISIITTVVVGVILRNQIKSQKELLNGYKNYIDAIDPKKIIMLHDKQVEQLKSTSETDISKLQKQVIELASYVDTTLTKYDGMAKSIGQPELFSRSREIDVLMPSCAGILEKVRNFRQSNTPKA